MPARDTVWRVEKEAPLTPASPVTLIWDNGQGLIFRRTIAVDADYLFTVTEQVENKTGAEITLHPFSLISCHGTPEDRRLLHPTRRPHRGHGRRRPAGAELCGPAQGWRNQDLYQEDGRLARHDRQVLGGSPDPRPKGAL
jgi:hypothetical protein